MNLRMKLTVGIVVLLMAALGLCCGIMIYKNIQLQEKEAFSYTFGEEKSVIRQFERLSGQFSNAISDQTQRSLHKYAFSEVALTSSEGSEFVLQGPDGDIYNNSGIDARAVLEKYGERKEEAHTAYTYMGAIIFWEHEYFCVVGVEREMHQKTYTISVVRSITDSMNEVKDLGGFCIGIGLFMLFLAAAGAFVYLKWQLRPLQQFQRDANVIAEKYAAAEAVSRTSDVSDEIRSLEKSFDQMQEAVKIHIGEVESKVEEQNMLLSALAHEMRTPVTAITGYAYALKHAKLTEDQRKEAIEFVDSESRRLERLSTKLTQLISVEHTKFTFSNIDLDDFGQRLEQILYAKVAEQGVHVIFSVKKEGEKNSCLYGDRDLLMVLVTNLFDNACKAGATEIQIRLQDSRIEVDDNGSGIERGELDKIMQPFYQGDASRKQEGFGLGLAICKRIARLHNARMTVSSEVGIGSRFIVQMDG